jgi:hypothetical protein
MALIGVFLFMMLAAVAVGIVIDVLFLLNLQRLLEAVRFQNRTMTPGHVWLNLIPVFNLGWMIYTVIKIRDSVRNENASRWGVSVNEGGTYNVGIAYAILCIAALVFYFGTYANDGFSVVYGLISLAALITWIIYWVKTNGQKNELLRTAGLGHGQQPGPYGYGGPQGPGGPYSPGQVPPAAWQAPPPTPPAGGACSRCGRRLKPDDRFCATCGAAAPGQQL